MVKFSPPSVPHSFMLTIFHGEAWGVGQPLISFPKLQPFFLSGTLTPLGLNLRKGEVTTRSDMIDVNVILDKLPLGLVDSLFYLRIVWQTWMLLIRNVCVSWAHGRIDFSGLLWLGETTVRFVRSDMSPVGWSDLTASRDLAFPFDIAVNFRNGGCSISMNPWNFKEKPASVHYWSTTIMLDEALNESFWF